jgi:quinoprotein dehydrogenase-associated probable ABC transporter substrate-binding protein
MARQSWGLGRRLCRGACFVLACTFGGAAALAAADEASPRKAFRVCKDANNMPFSNGQGEGFEDKIAALFAAQLGLPVETYTFPQRLGFVRNTLRFKLPGADYPCDIVMGVPADFGQVLSTTPYYRSTYVLVLGAGKGLDGVNSEADFLALPKEKLAALKIGVFDRSPASAWLDRHQLVDSGVPYRIMNANPADVPGEIIARDLASGAIDAAVVWGPIGGHFARRAQGGPLRVVPLASGPGVQFEYAMAMGVRFGEKAWKNQIEELIARNQNEIAAILRDYGVPLLAEPAAPAAGGGQQVAVAPRAAR